MVVTENKYILVYPPEVLLEDCFISPPPEVEWDDPDQVAYALTKYSVLLIHDNKECSRKIQAIREDRDRSVEIYKDAVK
jgi:hypothetical protein